MAAERLLESRQLGPSVEFAGFFDQQNDVLAEYQKAGVPKTPAPRRIGQGHSFRADGKLEILVVQLRYAEVD